MSAALSAAPEPSLLRTLEVPPLSRTLDAFVALVGERCWAARLRSIAQHATSGPRAGQAIRQRHAIELTLQRLRCPARRSPSVVERRLAALAGDLVTLARALPPAGRDRLAAMLDAALAGDGTLVPLFHLLHTAALQRARGFRVTFAGLRDGAPFDLLLARDEIEAELACDTVSAEEGRGVHRGAWWRFADRIDPDLQTWLGAHPGRYLLKMTLPQGLRGEEATLAALHVRIQQMLHQRRRRDDDAAVMLRLDPLLLVAAQADERHLLPGLRREFGPEAQLAVTAARNGVFVMAARAGAENEVAVAMRRRMACVAPLRLTGTRPGILAMFVEDTDREEWRLLRDRLELEGEARQFLTCPAARPIVAVTCASRLELFGLSEPDAASDGELRFRNPAHPAARFAALAPAVLSSV